MTALEPNRIYTASEVAAALSHGTRWFRMKRHELEREGFPPPVSRVGRPRWLGADLIAWLARPKPVARSGANVADMTQRFRRA